MVLGRAAASDANITISSQTGGVDIVIGGISYERERKRGDRWREEMKKRKKNTLQNKQKRLREN